jgi:DNA-binding LytR/AlgR family response regulator
MNKKINCIAIDDEPVALDIICDYINKIPHLKLLGTYRNALLAIEYLQNNLVDIVFLDINMPEINGIDFLKSLQVKPMIIFTTAYPEYAVKSYDLNATDYLLKPIEFERFLTSVNKASAVLSSNYKLQESNKQEDARFVILKSGSKSYKVNFSDILFIEGSGNYLTFNTSNAKIMVLMNMNEALNLLPETTFVRIHKSFIVSLSHITIIENHQVQIGTTKIPVGNYYRESFLNKISN